MKSHVRENLAKSVLSRGCTMTDIGNGVKEVQFVPMVYDIIKSKGKGITLKNWKFYEDNKMWEAVAVRDSTGASAIIRATGINEVINEASRSV